MVDLLVLNGSRAGVRFTLTELPAILGRSAEAHLRVDDPWISHLHALFERRGDSHWVVDFGSRNGTLVSGVRVPEAPLVVGAAITFGRTELRVVEHDASLASNARYSGSVARALALMATVRMDHPSSE